MRPRSSGVAVWLLAALSATAAPADDTRKNTPPGEDPDPSFLEFLGSVDGLADANPDYIAQASAARVAPAPPPSAPKPAQPPPPPPSGAKNNE